MPMTGECRILSMAFPHTESRKDMLPHRQLEYLIHRPGPAMAKFPQQPDGIPPSE